MRAICFAFLLLASIAGHTQTKADSIRMVKDALKLYDLAFTDAEIDSMLDGLKENRDVYYAMHKFYPPNELTYPFAFIPAPGMKVSNKKEKLSWDIPNRTTLPVDRNELAFYSIPQLAAL